jgi:hypothetical protein
MALTTCKECNRPISKSAKSCPTCGAKQGVGTCGCIAGILAVPVIFFIMLAVFGRNGGGSSLPSTPQGDYRLKSSAWDGSVHYVKEHVKMNLKDPDSYESIEWSNVQTLDDGTFSVRHKYRAKNSFGGYVVENKIFIYDSSGHIVSSLNYGN